MYLQPDPIHQRAACWQPVGVNVLRFGRPSGCADVLLESSRSLAVPQGVECLFHPAVFPVIILQLAGEKFLHIRPQPFASISTHSVAQLSICDALVLRNTAKGKEGMAIVAMRSGAVVANRREINRLV